LFVALNRRNFSADRDSAERTTTLLFTHMDIEIFQPDKVPSRHSSRLALKRSACNSITRWQTDSDDEASSAPSSKKRRVGAVTTGSGQGLHGISRGLPNGREDANCTSGGKDHDNYTRSRISGGRDAIKGHGKELDSYVRLFKCEDHDSASLQTHE
jgi:hypothetical protein